MNVLKGGETIELCYCNDMYKVAPEEQSTINSNHAANTKFGYDSLNCGVVVTPKPKN